MSSKTFNVPAYPVQNFTYLCAIIPLTVYTGTNPMAQTITGTTGLIRDKDTGTSYYKQTTSTVGAPDWDITDTITFDFGRVIWNVIIYCLYTQAADNKLLRISNDGSTWANLNANAAGSSTVAETYTALACRYLQFYQHSSFATAPNTCTGRYYEVRVSGSD